MDIRQIQILAACSLSTVLACAEDWPTFQHDARRSGYSHEQLNVPALQKAWSFQSDQPPQPAWAGPAKWDAYAGLRGLRSMRNYDPVFHPVVVGGSLFYGSTSDDAVHCLDTVTGREQWRFTTDAAVRIAPTYAGGRLYVGSDDGWVYCLSPADGSVLWKFRPKLPSDQVLYNGRFVSFWPCRTGVLVDNGTAYFALGLLPWKPSYLCAVDAATGRPEGPGRFVRQLEGVTFEGSLLASQQRIISPQGRVPPLLFRRRDGNPLGALEGGGGCFVLLTEDAHILHGPGNKTGWIQESGEADRAKIATFNGGNALVVAGDTSFLLSDKALVAMDRNRKRERWTTSLDCPFALIAFDQHLVAGGTDKLAVIRMGDGQVVWEASVEGKVYGLAVADRALFASTDTGLITCYREGDSNRVETSDTTSRVRASDPEGPLDPVAKLTDDTLLGRWVFQRPWVQGRMIRNLADGSRAQLAAPADTARLGSKQVLELDGALQDVVIAELPTGHGLPTHSFTAEAWVRVDQPLSWGGIVGCIQDNGDFERGWLLGYVNSRFSLGLTTQDGTGRMTYLQADSEFEPGEWYHVLGSYDGQEMKLFVDGQLQGSSSDQHGSIAYPSQGVYVIGAYWDENEHYRLTGALREVRVYNRALGETDASAHAALFRHKSAKPAHYEVTTGPCLRFVGPDQAILWWESERSVPTLLEYGLEKTEFQRVEDPLAKTHHEVTLHVPKRNRKYRYRIGDAVQDKPVWTEEFECDTFFNFSPAGIAPDKAGASLEAQHSVDRLLAAARVQKGIALVLGCPDPEIPLALATQTEMRVLVVDPLSERIGAARTRFQMSGLYGVRLSARHVPSWSALPFNPWFANLIIGTGAKDSEIPPNWATIISTYLRPSGGVALLRDSPSYGDDAFREALQTSLDRAADRSGGFEIEDTDQGLRIERRALPGAGEWSHQYGTGANSAFGGESLGGARGTSDLEVQWIGRPGPRAQADRNGRKPSPLAKNGRLFVQGLQRVIALDAFNGTVLWSLEIPPFKRFNMPRDCGNWCATDDSVFLAVGDRCWRVNARSGTVDHLYTPVAGARSSWDYDWGYISVEGDQLIGSSTKQGSAYVEYWGGADAGWYDAQSGPATYKVCSENLFALGIQSGRPLWNYASGLILNSTITIADHTAFFLETRHPKALQSDSRRLGQPELWQALSLTAVDLENGRTRWEHPVKPSPGTVVVYLAQSDRRLILVTSGSGQYHVYCHSDEDGRELWSSHFDWPKDNHGGHMARPAILGSQVYVRPRTFDLFSGDVLELAVPGGGCGTYAAVEGALVFRNSNVTLWDTKSGAVSSWDRLRPDCWLSTIPSDGLLLSPEAGGGCSCGSWLETSIAFRPAIPR